MRTQYNFLCNLFAERNSPVDELDFVTSIGFVEAATKIFYEFESVFDALITVNSENLLSKELMNLLGLS